MAKNLPCRYRVRAMVAADAEAVARLAHLFAPVSTTVFQGIDADDVSSWVRERLSRPDWAGFAGELEGEVVGFAFCQDMESQPSGFVFPQAKESVYLMYLAVDEAFRGQGLARALIEACEGLARDWGRSGLFLDVADDNPALGLYERLGFEHLGAQVFLRKKIEP